MTNIWKHCIVQVLKKKTLCDLEHKSKMSNPPSDQMSKLNVNAAAFVPGQNRNAPVFVPGQSFAPPAKNEPTQEPTAEPVKVGASNFF